MEQTRYDIVVIGGGTGGYVAAIRAAQLGLKTALVERDKVGGVCLHRGCIPTKVLLQCADVYTLMQRATDFGLAFDHSSLAFDYTKMKAKVDKVVSQLYRGVEFLLKKNNVTVFKGNAVFTSPTSLRVHSFDPITQAQGEIIAELTASNLLLSMGSRWLTLTDLPTQNPDGPILDADGALLLPNIPQSIAIVGAGQTGVEFASFYRALGVQVHLIEAGPRLLPAEDSEISTQLDRLFSRRGINLYLNTRLSASQVRLNADGAEINLTIKNKPKQIQVNKVLLALGRVPNVEGLEVLNVKLGLAGFISVDQNEQAASGIYAIGDMMGGFGFGPEGSYMLAHASSAQGIFVAEKLAGCNPDPIVYKAIPRCTYSNPQVASLGLTEAQARNQAQEQGRDPLTSIKVGKFGFKSNGRALMWGNSEGFVKIISDADSKDLLGVHIVGPTATELIGGSAVASLFDGTAWELAQATMPHPALTEVIMEAARDVDGWAIHQ